MAVILRKLGKILAAGLKVAAQAAALHEGQSWDDDTRRLLWRARNRR